LKKVCQVGANEYPVETFDENRAGALDIPIVCTASKSAPCNERKARLAGSEVKNAKFHAERHNEAEACGTVATCLACGITATHLACGTPILATVFCSFQAPASVPLQERQATLA
jgi:hypothetical protein